MLNVNAYKNKNVITLWLHNILYVYKCRYTVNLDNLQSIDTIKIYLVKLIYNLHIKNIQFGRKTHFLFAAF